METQREQNENQCINKQYNVRYFQRTRRAKIHRIVHSTTNIGNVHGCKPVMKKTSTNHEQKECKEQTLAESA